MCLTTLWVLAGEAMALATTEALVGERACDPAFSPGPSASIHGSVTTGAPGTPLPHVLGVWRPRPLAPAGLCEGCVHSGEGVRAGTSEAGVSAASGLSCVALGRSAPPGLGSSPEDDAVPACSPSCCELRNEQALQKGQLAVL